MKKNILVVLSRSEASPGVINHCEYLGLTDVDLPRPKDPKTPNQHRSKRIIVDHGYVLLCPIGGASVMCDIQIVWPRNLELPVSCKLLAARGRNQATFASPMQ